MHSWKVGDPLVLKVCIPNSYSVFVHSLEYGDKLNEGLVTFECEATETVSVSTLVGVDTLVTYIQNREYFDLVNKFWPGTYL